MAVAGERPLPPAYVFLEIGELLAAQLKRPEFLQTAVRHARAMQQIETSVAWAYAFEAHHGSEPARRVRAAAIAEYLDPQSARLAKVDAAVRREARVWLQKNPPFQSKGRPPQQAI